MSASASLQLVSFPEVRKKLGLVDNRSVRSACAKFGIPVVELNAKNLNLRESDLETLISRASRAEAEAV